MTINKGRGQSDTVRRIGVAEARKMLGMIGKNYENDEVQNVLDVLYGIAEEAFEDYAVHSISGHLEATENGPLDRS